VQAVNNSPSALLARLISPTENQPGLIFITGPKGSGKTLWCMDLFACAHARGLYVCGLISPSIFIQNEKIGIGLKDLRTGEQRRLAHLKGDKGGDIQTQDWELVAETLEWGNSVLEQVNSCDLLIIDEIGPFELEHGVGFVEGLRIIDKINDFPCVVVIRPSLIKEALERWNWANVIDVSEGIGK
jgi:nucleoside-triphosphatase